MDSDDSTKRLLHTYGGNVRAQRSRPGGLPDQYIHFGIWDRPASAGEGPRADFPAAQERLNEAVLRRAEVLDGQSLLDVGCGFGGTLAAINDRWSGMDLVGVNLDRRQLAIASEAVRPAAGNSLEWVEADACSMSFDRGRFERVLAVECIQHFSSRRLFLERASSVLSGGGILVFTDFVPSPEMRSAAARWWSLSEIDSVVERTLGPWPDFWGQSRDYGAMVAGAGLELEERVDLTEASLPTYECILGPRRQWPAIHPDSPGAGMQIMHWLQQRHLLRVEIMRCRKLRA